MVLYIGGNTTVQYLGNILVCCLGNELPVYVHGGWKWPPFGNEFLYFKATSINLYLLYTHTYMYSS